MRAQHYPGRLHQLFLVGLPPSLGWVLAAVRPALHPATAAKIRQCFASDACLPAQLRRGGPSASPALPPGLPASAASARASSATALASLAVDAVRALPYSCLCGVHVRFVCSVGALVRRHFVGLAHRGCDQPSALPLCSWPADQPD